MKSTYKTQLSEELIKIFKEQSEPSSFVNINNILLNKNLQYNKTSIYRQLQKMLEADIIQIIDTPNGKVWELKTNDKHAHLICDHCQSIICLNFDINIFQQIINSNNSLEFKIHNFSLSGSCSKCL